MTNARLPTRVLAAHGHDARTIHEAIFSARDRGLGPWLDPFKNFVSESHDPIIAAALLSMLLTGFGQPVLAGALHGYVLATFAEHAIHEFGGHGGGLLKPFDRLKERLGPLGEKVRGGVEDLSFGHGRMHHDTFRGDEVPRFAPKPAGKSEAQLRAEDEETERAFEAMAMRRRPETAAKTRGSDCGTKVADAPQGDLRIVPLARLMSLGTASLAGAGATGTSRFVLASVAVSNCSRGPSNYLP